MSSDFSWRRNSGRELHWHLLRSLGEDWVLLNSKERKVSKGKVTPTSAASFELEVTLFYFPKKERKIYLIFQGFVFVKTKNGN